MTKIRKCVTDRRTVTLTQILKLFRDQRFREDYINRMKSIKLKPFYDMFSEIRKTKHDLPIGFFGSAWNDIEAPGSAVIWLVTNTAMLYS